MAFNEPVLTKRIPLDPEKRKLIGYDDYVATGGYVALRKALEMKADEIIKTVTDSGLRGRDAVRRRLHLHPRRISPAGEGPREGDQGSVRQADFREAGRLRVAVQDR